MFYSHLKIAWRSLLRNRTNSLINIGGLAIGLTCVIFIVLYVQDERSYDKGFTKSDRLYQVNLDAFFGGQTYNTSYTPPPVAISLHSTFPEIEDYTRLFQMGNVIVQNSSAGDKAGVRFTEKHIWSVDSNFLQLLDYPFVEGDASSCLKKYHSIVLTESMAHKYFGSQSAIGRTLQLDTIASPFIVTGVLKDLPHNASLQFDMLTGLQDNALVKHFSWSWVWGQMNAYVLLSPKVAGNEAAIRQLQAKFPAMVRRDAAKAFARIGQNYDELIRKGGKWNFYLQPLTAIHLHSADLGTSVDNLGDIKYIYIFSAIAIVIVLLACINFMNLSTAQAVQRAKEVGIRKVLGSMKGQMKRQFLTEALLYTVISALFALALVCVFMAPFNALADKQLLIGSLFHHGLWLFILAVIVITGLLAGSYPAFYLTSFRPVDVLKGSGLFVRSAGTLFIRNGLVVFQFTVSIALIICTLVVYQQLRYMRTRDLGFRKDNVIIFPNIEKVGGGPIVGGSSVAGGGSAAAGRSSGPEEQLRQQLSRITGIHNASLSSGMPANSSSTFSDFYEPLTNGVKEPLAKDVTLTSFLVDEFYIPSLQLQLVAGRNFSPEFNDSASVIVNETTVRQVGWKDALGKRIRYPGNDDQTFTVIGVVRDFNTQSLRNAVAPFALFHVRSKTFRPFSNYIVANIDASSTPEVLRQAKIVWRQWAPGIPFEYSFLDRNYEVLYRSEERMGSVFSVITGLSILVACLGLFGLSIYTAERRVKEIGIRKILGASVQSVVGLLSKEFVKLVLLSAVIAFPLAWWAMSKWLEDFAYRVMMQVWVFALAALLALGIALLTVSSQAFRAARRNPARSLRSE
jgi:putative ABC transport system permease protein